MGILKKCVKWFVILFVVLFTISLIAVAPLPSIGWLLMLFGIYQLIQKRKGKVTFSKPGWIIASGIVLYFILAGVATDVDKESEISKETETEAVETTNSTEIVSNDEQSEDTPQVSTKEKQSVEEGEKNQNLAESLGLVPATVSRVVDGDTLELSDGRKVRLIGVNTPESTTKTEEYGKEASNYTKSKLEGKTIYLQKDVSDTDQYGRLLRIVWLEVPNELMKEEEIRSKMFNADLVLNGYAEPSTYPPDVTYSEYFVKFAREARGKEVGLWTFGANGTTKGDLDTQQKNSTSTSNTTTNSVSDSPKNTPQYESYQNCKALNAVYPSGVPSDHPAYASKHDRDKDGWACEK